MLNILTPDGLKSFIFLLPALLFSLSVHEFAHAWMAYKLGDSSQKIRGRLTLDPLKHIDPIGFLCIALCGVGWGRPVMVDERSFKNKARDTMLTSLAGPVSNLLLAVLLTIVLKILIVTNVISITATSTIAGLLLEMLLLAIQYNIMFGVFNLIPLPPLDGSKVLYFFLPGRAKNIMYTLERYSIFILMIIFCTNLTAYIINPAYTLVASFLDWILML